MVKISYKNKPLIKSSQKKSFVNIFTRIRRHIGKKLYEFNKSFDPVSDAELYHRERVEQLKREYKKRHRKV